MTDWCEAEKGSSNAAAGEAIGTEGPEGYAPLREMKGEGWQS